MTCSMGLLEHPGSDAVSMARWRMRGTGELLPCWACLVTCRHFPAKWSAGEMCRAIPVHGLNACPTRVLGRSAFAFHRACWINFAGSAFPTPALWQVPRWRRATWTHCSVAGDTAPACTLEQPRAARGRWNSRAQQGGCWLNVNICDR